MKMMGIVLFLLAALLLVTAQFSLAGWVPYSERYGVVIMGGPDSGQLYKWYWGDTSGMYYELRDLGFGDDNILFLAWGDSADAHPEIVDKSTTKSNVQWAFDQIETQSTANDLVYVFWVDHGGPQLFNLPGDNITHAEYNDCIKNIIAKQIIGAYNPCYSGAVIDDVSRSGVVSITSVNDIQGNSFGWAGTWRHALRGGTEAELTDSNGDGYISMTEAYDWVAPQSQAYSEHPWFDDNGDGVGSEYGTSGYDPNDPSKDGYIGSQYSLTGWWSPTPEPGSLRIDVPNGYVYWNDGDEVITSFTPSQNITANFVTMNCLDDNNNDSGSETFEVAITTDSGGSNVIASAQITNNFRNTGGCDAHKYSFDFGDVTLTGGTTYYLRTQVLAGAEVRAWAGATLYYNDGYPDHDRVTVNVPNGHVYWNDGDYITTEFSLTGDGTAHFVTMACLDDNDNDSGSETFEVAITTDSGGSNVIASAQITNNFRNTGGCDEHMYLFDFVDVSLTGGVSYYLRTKVLAGAEVRTWGGDRLYFTQEEGDCEGIRGDPTGDGGINVLDVLAVVNHILGVEILTGDAFCRGDCDADGDINVLDALGIVNVILGTGECPPTTCKPRLTSEVMEFLKSLEPYFSVDYFAKFMALVKAEVQVPTEYSLAQNYPNPFNPNTTILFALPDGARRTEDGGQESLHTSLKIYNLLGQEVRTLVDEIKEPGYYTVTWDGKDGAGRQVSSGMYFYRLSVASGQWSETKRMVLMK